MLVVNLNIHSQITSLDFPKEIKSDGDEGKPTMRLEGDSLFVCCTDGIYCKNLANDSEWEPYAFQGYPIEAFVRHEGVMIAAAFNMVRENEAIVLRSADNGNTVENITPESMHFKGGVNSAYYVVTNPENPMSLVFATTWGAYLTNDFGNSWEKKERMEVLRSGGMVLNPSDTTEIVSFGEFYNFGGCVIKYSHYIEDGFYFVPGGDNQVVDYFIHPQSPNLRLLTAHNTIGRSTDGGCTWALTPMENCLIEKFLIDQEKGTIYGIGKKWQYVPGHPGMKAEYVIYLSNDEGENWILMYEDDKLMVPGSFRDVYDAVIYNNHILILSFHGVYDVIISDPTIEGISEMAAEHNPYTVIHDMQGRALNEKPAKGVYIQDGKKWMIR